MHAKALFLMELALTTYPQTGGNTLLDVGSYDVNGTYRDLCQRLGYQYTGLDIVPGPNVNIVAPDPYRFPLADANYAVVICGQTLEHVPKPWLFVPELARVLQPGGLLVVGTHHVYPLHRHPVDCWRFLPDGMQVLFDEAGCLERYDIFLGSPQDIMGIAYKREVRA